MKLEQKILAKLSSLSPDKQKEVLDFIELLGSKKSVNKTCLEEDLQQIRTRIVASGKILLNENNIRKQLVSRENGVDDKVYRNQPEDDG
jgi:predicted secreted protein